jgi:hypothetical protein
MIRSGMAILLLQTGESLVRLGRPANDTSLPIQAIAES